MSETRRPPRRILALLGLVLSLGLLLPGLILPVITIHGALQPSGLADLAPVLVAKGLTEQSVEKLKPMLSPTALSYLNAMPGGLRGALIAMIGSQIASDLRTSEEIVVYEQTRSILGSVRHLYEVGSNTAATLILLFSVIVPFAKMALVCWAVFHSDETRRGRALGFVETIAKWSMADVFAVALFIAYLAAQATQSAGGAPGALVTFRATFGPGFYWFTGYCLCSLAVQQATARWIMAKPAPATP